jgi:hypothetical protein
VVRRVVLATSSGKEVEPGCRKWTNSQKSAGEADMRGSLKLLLVGLVIAGATPTAVSVAPPPNTQAKGPAKTPGKFELVGHSPLRSRGMNAAIAVKGKYAYIGSRTDGLHPNAGVLVVDISNPKSPEIVHEIGPPNEGNIGETSRELRIWPEKNLLIVMNLGSNCSPLIHNCSPTNVTVDDNFRFYDIGGKNARAPKLVAEYLPTRNPHEMFLWDDPNDRGRALMFSSTPSSGGTQLLVTDISGARRGKFKELGTWTTVIPDEEADTRLHSISISTDGKRGYLSYLGGGFFIIDTSQFALGKKDPKVRLVTPIGNRVHWGNPGVHSAVKLFNKPWVLTTDEVYGNIPVLLADHGCPWGWVRFVNVRNPKKPKVVSHYKLRANEKSFCDDSQSNPPDRHHASSWSAHNPTLTEKIAFVSWHSGGLQAISLKNPGRPRQLARFRPEPLSFVTMEDPALSSGRDKVVVWSYPIIKDGLIYVVDVRNGLYILRYKGPGQRHVKGIDFIEGNSNLKDARRLD